MDLADIQDQVRFLTKEPFPSSPQFATNSRVLTYANIALKKIASLTKCDVSSNVPNSTGQPSLVTVANQRLYAFPDDCLELLTVKVAVYALKRKPMDWFNQYMGFQWWTFTGVPMYWYVEKKSDNSFGIFYTPSSSGQQIALWYVRKPDELVNQDDIPDIDERLQMAIVYYCCEAVMEGRREMSYKSGYWYNKFLQEITQYNNTADQSLEPVELMGEVPASSD